VLETVPCRRGARPDGTTTHGNGAFAVSAGGTRANRTDARPGSQIVWSDRSLDGTMMAVGVRPGDFLILEPTQSVEPPSLTIITNWTNLLKK